MRRSPIEVLPDPVAKAVSDGPYWFVIGGQAVRCICPYRPSRDVDFGVPTAKNARELLRHLEKRGRVEVIERDTDTVHLQLDGVDVSIFVLKKLAPHVEEQSLGVRGILATKTHALLDRGTRRDFFDVYVMLELHKMGLVDCITALEDVYETKVNHGLLLRALCYFDDAEREPPLPGEGKSDWETVTTYFATAVAALIVAPQRALQIQRRIVDVRTKPSPRGKAASPRRRKRSE